MAPLTDAATLLHFVCPRCAVSVHEQFYGPCLPCINELRATQRLNTQTAAVADYVPKMNVVPNAVASKD